MDTTTSLAYTPSYTPAVTNISPAPTSGAADNANTTAAVDPRRYTQYDRSATDAGTATMSFDDFVDMINPLEHIPVISSVYRDIEGESINPVSRIVGDILYSGPMGMVSAAVSGVSALANSVLESQTGSDGLETLVAGLFGPGDHGPTAMAENQATTTPDAVADQQMPISLLAAATMPVKTLSQQANTGKSEKAAMDKALGTEAPSEDDDTENAQSISKPQNITVADNTDDSPAPSADRFVPGTNTKFLPLDRTRINTRSNDANDIESQNRIIALSEGSHTMRVGHMIYTSPLMNGPKPMPYHQNPSANSNANQTATTPTATAVASTPETTDPADATVPAYMQSNTTAQKSMLSTQANSIPPALFDDVMILKRLNQYKSFATAPVTNGATLDITN